jgi:hypothetical protein
VPGRQIGLRLPVTVRFHPLRIRHAVHIGCAEPSRWVQFVQFDQQKHRGTDFAAASHAEGRWFDPSRDHPSDLHEHGMCTLLLVRFVRFASGDRWFHRFGCVESVEVRGDLVKLV